MENNPLRLPHVGGFVDESVDSNRPAEKRVDTSNLPIQIFPGRSSEISEISTVG
jgi:hypothetical protein